MGGLLEDQAARDELQWRGEWFVRVCMYIFQLRMIICYLNRQFSGLNPNSDALKLITVSFAAGRLWYDGINLFSQSHSSHWAMERRSLLFFYFAEEKLQCGFLLLWKLGEKWKVLLRPQNPGLTRVVRRTKRNFTVVTLWQKLLYLNGSCKMCVSECPSITDCKSWGESVLLSLKLQKRHYHKIL